MQLLKKTKSFATNDWWLVWSSPLCHPIFGWRWQEHIAQTIAKKPGHTKTPSMSIQAETKDASIMHIHSPNNFKLNVWKPIETLIVNIKYNI